MLAPRRVVRLHVSSGSRTASSYLASSSRELGGSHAKPWRLHRNGATCSRLYYPQSFLDLGRETVAQVCRALGDIGPSEKLMFWLRDHGALAGKSVAAALETGVPVAKVERLATAWARERGASRVAAAA